VRGVLFFAVAQGGYRRVIGRDGHRYGSGAETQMSRILGFLARRFVEASFGDA